MIYAADIIDAQSLHQRSSETVRHPVKVIENPDD